VLEVLADVLGPPLALGHHQGHRTPPFRGWQRRTSGTIERRLALVRIEVGNGTQQQGLATARCPVNADALGGLDTAFDRTDMAGR
jgi:hypothetical protein